MRGKAQMGACKHMAKPQRKRIKLWAFKIFELAGNMNPFYVRCELIVYFLPIHYSFVLAETFMFESDGLGKY